MDRIPYIIIDDSNKGFFNYKGLVFTIIEIIYITKYRHIINFNTLKDGEEIDRIIIKCIDDYNGYPIQIKFYVPYNIIQIKKGNDNNEKD